MAVAILGLDHPHRPPQTRRCLDCGKTPMLLYKAGLHHYCAECWAARKA